MNLFCSYKQLLTGVLLLAALALIGTRSSIAKEPQGEKLYHDFGCVYCHGYYGHGGNAGGTRALAPSPYSFESFGTFVRTPQRMMPAYPRQHLSDEQLSKIYKFVQSIEKSPDVEDIPQLEKLQKRFRKVE